jgi:WXXGXW repeat (2 copies)
MMRILRSLGYLLLTTIILGAPAASNAQVAVGISVRVGPPVLPVYAQPVCPGPGYIWTPGYWAYGDDDYYWVPGTWVLAPEPGLLWTPGYWGFAEGVYVWHRGYWGPHVGFYGGINYGYGYTGVGFWGGEWRGREFVYNREVTNVNVTVIHNYYNRTVVVNNVNRVSFNGGPHGIQARESERERMAEREHHFEARREQIDHERAARADRSQWASVNHGRPMVAASGRPGDFRHDVVASREAIRPEHGPEHGPGGNSNVGHNDRPPSAMSRERESSRPRETGRPNDAHVDHGRDARPMADSHGRGQAPVEHGNQHADRGPASHGAAQRGSDHGSAPHGNEAHGNSGHPENNKQDHGKDRGKP